MKTGNSWKAECLLYSLHSAFDSLENYKGAKRSLRMQTVVPKYVFR